MINNHNKKRNYLGINVLFLWCIFLWCIAWLRRCKIHREFNLPSNFKTFVLSQTEDRTLHLSSVTEERNIVFLFLIFFFTSHRVNDGKERDLSTNVLPWVEGVDKEALRCHFHFL